jgi:hypothetical protein
MASVAAVGVALITIVASAYIGSHVLAGFGDVRVGVGVAGAVGAMARGGAQILRAYFVAGTRFVWLDLAARWWIPSSIPSAAVSRRWSPVPIPSLLPWRRGRAPWSRRRRSP